MSNDSILVDTPKEIYRRIQLKDCSMKFGSAFSSKLKLIDRQFTADQLKNMTQVEFLESFNQALCDVTEARKHNSIKREQQVAK